MAKIIEFGKQKITEPEEECKISDFERQAIFRLDYIGPLDTMLNEVVKQFEPEIKKYGMEQAATLPPQPAGNGVETVGRVPINEASLNMPVYKFIGDKKNLEISRQFLTFTMVLDDKENIFSRYIGFLSLLINAIKDSSQIFRMLRIGFRKIYICYLTDAVDTKDYFRPGVFDLENTIAIVPNYTCRAVNSTSILSTDGYKINYVRNLQDRDESDVPVCQAAIDIDVHIENTKELLTMPASVNEADKTFREVDRIASELFFASLKKDFASSLSKGALFFSDI